MCGIAGFAGLATSAASVPDVQVLRRMCDTIVHRGPDDEGMRHDGRVGIGMRRLSIIDLAGGHQPIANEDDTVFTVFNGEIYNFRELRHELEGHGHTFRTRSDTEVIVHGYEQWGADVVRRLNGMFAIAVYDVAQGKVLLARDHVGIKPLYYALGPECLVWGSEIKTVLASGVVPRELDLDALGQFIAWEFCPGEMTLLEGVRKLLPAHLMTLDLHTGNHRIHRYWSPPDVRDAPALTDAQWIDRVDAGIEAAVQRQMVSDVPLGAFLSGGVDSSLIARAMGRATTFSIGSADPSYNELEHSSRVARHLGVEHVTDTVDGDVLELFDHLMTFMDDPIGDSSIFPTYLVSRLARSRVTVSLSGDGADELFAGYETYQASRLADSYERLPRILRRGIVEPAASWVRPTPAKKGLVNKALRFLEGMRHEPGLGHARWRVFLTEEMKRQVFTPQAAAAMTSPLSGQVMSLFEEARDRAPLSQKLYVDTFSYLPDDILTKVDRMSMAVSLEARVPYLDREFVELAFQVPDRLKIRDGQLKWILKKVAERYLPKANVYRPKEGFSAPVKHWIVQGGRKLLEELVSERRIRAEGVFDWPAVDRLKQEHLSGRRNHSHQLWAIMMFHAWQDRWLDDSRAGRT